MARFALIVEAGGRAVDDEGRDLHRTLEYRATTSVARLLPTGLLLIFIGLALLVLADARDKPASRGDYLFIVIAVALGLGVIAVTLRARYRPGKPVFTLSPAGIGHRWVRQVLIPWHEVQAIETADIVTKLFNPMSLVSGSQALLYRTSLYPDVTVIVVSRQFYESRLHVSSFWLRGPGWKGNFIPYGETVQVALHHELVAADRQQLRQAVRSRWLAFRDQSAARQGATTVPMTGPSRARPGRAWPWVTIRGRCRASSVSRSPSCWPASLRPGPISQGSGSSTGKARRGKPVPGPSKTAATGRLPESGCRRMKSSAPPKTSGGRRRTRRSCAGLSVADATPPT